MRVGCAIGHYALDFTGSLQAKKTSEAESVFFSSPPHSHYMEVSRLLLKLYVCHQWEGCLIYISTCWNSMFCQLQNLKVSFWFLPLVLICSASFGDLLFYHKFDIILLAYPNCVGSMY